MTHNKGNISYPDATTVIAINQKRLKGNITQISLIPHYQPDNTSSPTNWRPFLKKKGGSTRPINSYFVPGTLVVDFTPQANQGAPKEPNLHIGCMYISPVNDQNNRRRNIVNSLPDHKNNSDDIYFFGGDTNIFGLDTNKKLFNLVPTYP